MTEDGERMGGNHHAHRMARTETRQSLWALHQKLVDMGTCPMWNVYAPPYHDYGSDLIVARLCKTKPVVEQLPYAFCNEDLDELRLMRPPTCISIPPAPDDPPHIIEVWI